jgi:hypothetical protein
MVKIDCQKGTLKTYCIHLQYLRIVRHGHVDQLGDEIPWRGLADQQPDLLEGVGYPREQDEQRDANGADRVQVPDKAVSDDRHYQAKTIYYNIIAVVDLESRQLMLAPRVVETLTKKTWTDGYLR